MNQDGPQMHRDDLPCCGRCGVPMLHPRHGCVWCSPDEGVLGGQGRSEADLIEDAKCWTVALLILLGIAAVVGIVIG